MLKRVCIGIAISSFALAAAAGTEPAPAGAAEGGKPEGIHLSAGGGVHPAVARLALGRCALGYRGRRCRHRSVQGRAQTCTDLARRCSRRVACPWSCPAWAPLLQPGAIDHQLIDSRTSSARRGHDRRVAGADVVKTISCSAASGSLSRQSPTVSTQMRCRPRVVAVGMRPLWGESPIPATGRKESTVVDAGRPTAARKHRLAGVMGNDAGDAQSESRVVDDGIGRPAELRL